MPTASAYTEPTSGGGVAERALDFYEVRYSDFPPHVLAGEVARCRSLLMHQPDTDTRRVLGWFSALLGNLAHHTSDPTGALIHLGTAARIGAQVGDTRLSGWALGAQSMVTMSQDRPAEALELADHAAQYATTPLRRAQVTAWCRLRPLAALGDTSGVAEGVRQARWDMDRSEDVPGRFGFDMAEFQLHVAEASLAHGAIAARARNGIRRPEAAGLTRVGRGDGGPRPRRGCTASGSGRGRAGREPVGVGPRRGPARQHRGAASVPDR